jgi:hypothetical protein
VPVKIPVELVLLLPLVLLVLLLLLPLLLFAPVTGVFATERPADKVLLIVPIINSRAE